MAQQEREPVEHPSDQSVAGNPDDGVGWNGPKGFWAFIALILLATLFAGFALT